MWTQSNNPRRSYCYFSVWPYDLGRTALRVALGSGVIFTKFDLQQLMRAWIIAFLMLMRYITLWPWPLTSWPWTFTALRMSCVSTLHKIWAKSYRWVIDDLARFRRAILGVGISAQRFAGVRGPNFTKLGEDIERSFLHKKFVSAFGYFAAFSNACGSNWVMFWRRQISNFLTSTCEN